MGGDDNVCSSELLGVISSKYVARFPRWNNIHPSGCISQSLSVYIRNSGFDVILPQREAETKAKVQEKRCAKRLAVCCTCRCALR